MNKRILLLLIPIIALIGATLVYLRLPPLPLLALTPLEAIVKMNKTNGIVKLGTENGVSWYGSKTKQFQSKEVLKSNLATQGWQYVTQEGAGLFFRKGDKRIVITMEMWTGYFVLYRVPSGIPLMADE